MKRYNIDKVMTRPMSNSWPRNKTPQNLDQVFALSRRNYMVYADLGSDPQNLRHVLALLDTGDGPNFIRKAELPEGADELIKYDQISEVCDTKGKQCSTLGSVNIKILLGRFLELLELIVCEKLAAPAILGTEYCDRFIEAIIPRKKCVGLNDGSTVPIVRLPLRLQAEEPTPRAWEPQSLTGVHNAW